jgi:type II secretory ATPase GspE/PulE/Tfp pilus assembly ATPase PilB-like protein
LEKSQEQIITFLKGEMSAEERKAFEESLIHSPALRAEMERGRELLDLMEAANEQATANRVDRQIRGAIERGASDIHVIPGKHSTTVYFRLDGALVEAETLPRDLTQCTIDRWKLLADCSLTERQLPQEGRILVTHSEKEFDLRVTILPTVLGERVTVRILDRPNDTIELDRLGFSSSQLEALRRMTWRPNGLVLVCGPAGSGKTVTLYAAMLDLMSPERPRGNIMTVEEPVGFVLDGISQTRVNRRLGLTYPVALRAVFHSDLDVLMIDDLPDQETAELALEMAATGHLVLAQVTAKHSLAAITRLREIGVGSFVVGQTLAGVLSQRLVRRVCNQCSAEYAPPPALLERFQLALADGPYQHGTGCAACRQTGYKGRVAFYEFLEVDDRFRQLLGHGAPEEVLRNAAAELGTGSLWDDARAKVRLGSTTVEEAARVLFDYPLPAAPSAAVS